MWMLKELYFNQAQQWRQQLHCVSSAFASLASCLVRALHNQVSGRNPCAKILNKECVSSYYFNVKIEPAFHFKQSRIDGVFCYTKLKSKCSVFSSVHTAALLNLGKKKKNIFKCPSQSHVSFNSCVFDNRALCSSVAPDQQSVHCGAAPQKFSLESPFTSNNLLSTTLWNWRTLRWCSLLRKRVHFKEYIYLVLSL